MPQGDADHDHRHSHRGETATMPATTQPESSRDGGAVAISGRAEARRRPPGVVTIGSTIVCSRSHEARRVGSERSVPRLVDPRHLRRWIGSGVRVMELREAPIRVGDLIAGRGPRDPEGAIGIVDGCHRHRSLRPGCYASARDQPAREARTFRTAKAPRRARRPRSDHHAEARPSPKDRSRLHPPPMRRSTGRSSTPPS